MALEIRNQITTTLALTNVIQHKELIHLLLIQEIAVKKEVFIKIVQILKPTVPEQTQETQV